MCYHRGMEVYLSDGTIWEIDRHTGEILKDYIYSGLKKSHPVDMYFKKKKRFKGHLSLVNVIGVGEFVDVK